MVEPLRRGEPFRWRSLGAELGIVPLSDARERGLPAEAAASLAEHDPGRRALEVVRVAAGTPAAALLQPGDLLLAAGGQPVTSHREVERAAQREVVLLSVLRDGELRELDVPTLELDPIGTRRALLFAGALLQPVPYVVQLQRGVPAEGVYVVGRWYGSPVERYGLRATRRILEVGGVPTPDLDAFLAAVVGVPERGDLQLLAEDLDGKREVVTLEVDFRYWPTQELRWNGAGWEVGAAQSGYSISTAPLGTN
jgi:S1-C subfamily serine protease